MNLTKYQALLKTVELGSITRAAEAMGYTQSALSRAIADLEREWDLELLTRSRSGVALSSDGNVLLPAIRSLCNAAKMLEEQVAELHGMTRGTLRVGTFTSVSIHWLPGIMKVFLDRYPGIHFELVSSWEFAEIEDLIRRGEVDCGFLRVPAGEGLDTIPLRQDRLLAALPPDHPLAHAPCYPIARFTQEPYIRISEERDMEISRIFQEEGVRPNLQYNVNDDFAILAMVEQGLGVSIMPELVLRDSNRRFSAIPLDHPRFREIGLAVRSGKAPSPLTSHFLSCVQELVTQMDPDISPE
ncbi:LysR family transcriptional regulator [Pseudoflavonifractor phocaeensis]|uniref:LysR family transcriptional regulator n=1 Tax=Pseudoflavonifractor phocaeensis TaxID=1870988 RepID=UPI001FAFE3D4|nr:LysR family transcriptional regulator [Pseudoflavonifractor phocaeensis]